MSDSCISNESFLPFSELDHLIQEALRSERISSHDDYEVMDGMRVWIPRMDAYEDTKRHRVIAMFELPGLTQENVSIEYLNGRLTISGESNPPLGQKHAHSYGARERRYGKFARSLVLPHDVRPEDVKAAMENGLLTVKFPSGSAQQAQNKTASPFNLQRKKCALSTFSMLFLAYQRPRSPSVYSRQDLQATLSIVVPGAFVAIIPSQNTQDELNAAPYLVSARLSARTEQRRSFTIIRLEGGANVYTTE